MASTIIGLAKVLRDSGSISQCIVMVHLHVCLRLWAPWGQVYLIISCIVSPASSKNMVHCRQVINVEFFEERCLLVSPCNCSRQGVYRVTLSSKNEV